MTDVRWQPVIGSRVFVEDPGTLFAARAVWTVLWVSPVNDRVGLTAGERTATVPLEWIRRVDG